MSIAVITPTLPERVELVREAILSVKTQRIACTHHVYLDAQRRGPAMARNYVIDAADTYDYVAFLDDDDLLDEDHLELLHDALLLSDADLAFSWYRREGAAPETERVHVWGDYAYGVMLGGRNLVPVTVVAKRQAIIDAGGFDPDDRYEDYGLWLRMLSNDPASFVVVPRETWTYRCLGGNRTFA